MNLFDLESTPTIFREWKFPVYVWHAVIADIELAYFALIGEQCECLFPLKNDMDPACQSICQSLLDQAF